MNNQDLNNDFYRTLVFKQNTNLDDMNKQYFEIVNNTIASKYEEKLKENKIKENVKNNCSILLKELDINLLFGGPDFESGVIYD